MKRTNSNNKSETKNIRFEHWMIEEINKARGVESFSEWVKDACDKKMRTK